jgi:hypothetical protein
VMELWCACAWGIRNRLHAAVGVALGDGVVVRMRLGKKKQVTYIAMSVWPWVMELWCACA